MAESSMLWNTTGTGDGPGTGYTQANWVDFFRYFFTPDVEATAFVMPRKGNKLACTVAANQVNVDTGAAIGYGFFYKNTASIPIAVSSPLLGTTGLIVVLRASWAAQTVRAAVVKNSDGVSGIPSATQTPGTTYEVVLATGTITVGGTIVLTDTRGYLAVATEILGSMLNAAIVDASTIEIATNVLRVKDAGITSAKIAAAVAGNGLSGGAGTALAVNVDNSTIEISSDSLRVKDAGIVLAKLAADSVDDTKLGNRVAQFIRRYGGSATDWSVTGTTSRTPTTIRCQAGVLTSGGTTVTQTFNVAFSNPPIVVASPASGGGARGYTIHATNITASDVTFEVHDDNGTVSAGIVFHWIAFGPE